MDSYKLYTGTWLPVDMQGKLRSSIAGPDVKRKRPFDTQTSSDEDEFSDLETDSECSDEDHAK